MLPPCLMVIFALSLKKGANLKLCSNHFLLGILLLKMVKIPPTIRTILFVQAALLFESALRVWHAFPPATPLMISNTFLIFVQDISIGDLDTH